MTDYTEVLFNELEGAGGAIGEIILNRPQVLNSLNLSMVHAIHNKLEVWKEDAAIKAVVISGRGERAFCAGGDLRSTYTSQEEAEIFFRDEYRLNQFIFEYPKPYIALLNGITMGGGVGISLHGSHRIATEHLLFAMPETGIGFFPDVGGTYFLPRLPHHFGYYLGLTGARLKSDDCVALSLTQHKVAAQSLPALVSAIALKPFKQDANISVTEVIQSFALPCQSSSMLGAEEEINHSFSAESVEAIIAALKLAKHPLCHEALTAITKKSPTSLKVTLRALNEGKQLQFADCMKQEYRLARHFLQSHDFPEGIRAVIIDKDQDPRWRPNTLEKVSPALVESFFKQG